MAEATPASATEPGDLAGLLKDDLLTLDRELAEIDLLISQATTEAGRHESRRAAAAEKFESLPAYTDPTERADQATTLVTLTKRAALMETQVEVLDGKRRALARYHDAVAAYLEALNGPAGALGTGVDGLGSALASGAPMPPAVSRMVLGAQEDLRREIAREMHDGPAQSLTNIVLQAQIVERLVARDPEMAASEVRQLIEMVQQTLDATKTFIFDVRPMVLDDLGLVPTLRRATRERGRRAGVEVSFESLGTDRRLAMELESGLFRILDEALAAYLGAAPDAVAVRLDWAEQLEARVTASRAYVPPTPSAVPAEAPQPRKRGQKEADLPPALMAMIEDRKSSERDAEVVARQRTIVVLPTVTWREIQSRAASIGVTAELLAEGGELRLVADLSAAS
jgi:two-component system sensor histidine kinase DegS